MMNKHLESVEFCTGFLLKQPASLDDLSVFNKMDEMYHEIKVRHSLTTREIEVLMALTILGQSNTNLGALLNITENTVKNHIARIMDKTNTHELQALTSREIMIPLLQNILIKGKNKRKKKANSAN